MVPSSKITSKKSNQPPPLLLPLPLPLPLPPPPPPAIASTIAVVMLSCYAFAHTPSHSHGRPEFDSVDALRRILLNPAAAAALSLPQLKQVHARILRAGSGAIVSDDPSLLPSLLIRHYSSSRHHHPGLDLASRLFDSSFPSSAPPPPTITWNLIISAHANAPGDPLGALRLFGRMLSLDVPPDKFSFPFALKACSNLANLRAGKQVHALAIKTGFCRDRFVQNTLVHFYCSAKEPAEGRKALDGMRARDVVSWTALVSGLVACGEMHEARAIFELMPVRNVVTWTAMIDGYIKNDLPDDAFRLFLRMHDEDNVRPNEFTIVAMAMACSQMENLRLGRWVHAFAHKSGQLERGVYVGTALVDMYSKCGSLQDAMQMFAQMSTRSLATWNSTIMSLAVHDHGEEAIALFRDMEKKNVMPDHITFVSVLHACARGGLLHQGFSLFTYMMQHYRIKPCHEHFCCLAELLGSCRDTDEAIRVATRALRLDITAGQLLVKACEANGSARLAGALNDCINRVEMPKHSACAATYGNQCFEWEVG